MADSRENTGDSGCAHVRASLLELSRGSLPPELAEKVKEHLGGCAECRQRLEMERGLDAALDRLPRYAASDALKERIATMKGNAAMPRRSRWVRAASAAAALLVVGGLGAGLGARSVSNGMRDAIVSEAVNDHLRVLYAQKPIEIESGGIHQVKPWFEGKLDFSPNLGFEGDSEFALEGGSVAYFLDRKAATFVFKYRLHLLTLFVFRADGLPWQSESNLNLGELAARSDEMRGFNVVSWRRGDLGYALVSDVNSAKLSELSRKLAATH